MRKSKVYLSIVFCFILFLGCQPENDINVLPPSNLRSIVSFNIYRYNNPLYMFLTVTGTIDETNKIITLKFPAGSYTKLDSIRPAIYIAPWATVSPNNLEYVDLRPDTVEYTVTAQSGKKTVYAVVKK